MDSTTTSLLSALRPLVRRIRAEHTLSPGKVSVLHHLMETQRATTTELAAATHVTQQGMSLAVRELEQLGLVSKVPDSEDRRRTWIELTPEGRQRQLDESTTSHQWLTQAITQTLTPQERESLQAAIPVLYKLGTETAHE